MDADFEQHYFTLLEDRAHHAGLQRVCAFDLVANNADRKSGHCLLGRDGRVWAIDNGLCFHVSQAFFPRTGAWENLKKALKASHDESVWDHLAGTASAPFEAGEQRQVAVKVIDDRGNELLVVKNLKEAEQ